MAPTLNPKDPPRTQDGTHAEADEHPDATRASATLPTGAHPGSIRDDLLERDAYPPGLARSAIELVETHISWVFLLDDDVFKVKKPVNLGFLDFRTPERRFRACEAEVMLNRRLAPDVYIGVVPVRRGERGRMHLGGDGPIVDWAVHMKRLPDELRADRVLDADLLAPARIDAIAATMAAFHADCRSDWFTARFGMASAIERNIDENFSQTEGAIEEYLKPAEADELRRWQRAFLRGYDPAFRMRAVQGRVRDGHGDLRLEHVYFTGERVTVLDCIEFNERFRFADVCADIAFLSMDLASRGRVDLAERLLAAYAREADDFDLYSVVDFYESYRAFVRGKIAAMLAGDENLDDAGRRRAREDARRYFLLSLSADRRPLLAASVVAVGGVIGSGKSTIAEAIGPELGAPIIDADRTRKAMWGASATARLYEAPWSGAYDPLFTKDVYAEVLRRAGVVLDSGRPVVLDASFRSVEMRRAARDLAVRHNVPFLLVECRAPAALCKARLVQRQEQRTVSDGRLAIFDDFCARFQPITELSPSEHIVIDTSRPLEHSLQTLRQSLATWPRGLP